MNIKKINETMEQLTNNLVAKLGEDLISFYLFGSVIVDKDFHPGVSDINTLIVLSDKSEPVVIIEISNAYKDYKKLPFAIPLIFKKSEIEQALDVFPIEFIEMKERNVLLYGEDILKDVKVTNDNIRKQCEMEIRAKVLGLRKMFFAENELIKHQEYLFKSLTSTIVLLKQILRIKKVNIPETRDEILDELEKLYQKDLSGIKNLYTMRSKSVKITKNIIEKLIENYIKDLEFMGKMINEIN
ncbi:MAG: hypothetical protein N2999_05390 [Proteobacteria bacterium]|nr:hypothetical protein [Pseudomonadota bacterium]